MFKELERTAKKKPAHLHRQAGFFSQKTKK
jgi:hypothetical protein